ncbi:uncharacterized protein ARMOST_03831 [Armillaria ostoyae]|uniref:Uncharacterized protein n=1 Tax=Armillaria ostoyae TaxID=47428 RepID=A0A284QVK5_ARMOS|nr:uncharacterized protein ARMOST_03831 [Armillaria ostoyae]
MESSIKIPKPPKLTLNTPICELLHHLEPVGFSKSEFEDLKAYIRLSSFQSCLWGLIPLKLRNEQPPHAWREFEAAVLQKYPRLHKFEQAWPIETYFDMWVRNDKWRRGDRKKTQSKSGDRTPWRGNSEPTTKKIKLEEERTFLRPYRTRAVLGDIRNINPSQALSPISVNRLQSARPLALQSNGAVPSVFIQGPTSLLGQVSLQPPATFPFARASTIDCFGLRSQSAIPAQPPNGATASAYLPAAAPASNISQTSTPALDTGGSISSGPTRPLVTSSAAKDGESFPRSPEACLTCGAQPEANEVYVRELISFLDADKESNLLSILRMAGIFTSHHFHLLTQMSREERDGFFRLLSPGYLNEVTAMNLKKRLEEYAQRSALPKSSSPGEGDTIPEPSIDIKDELVDRACLPDRFAQVMQISRDKYDELVKTIPVCFKRIVTENPDGSYFHEITEEQWSSFVSEVSQAHPFLTHYPNSWPLEVYIRSQMKETSTPPQMSGKTKFSSSFQDKVLQIFTCPGRQHMIPGFCSYPIPTMLQHHFRLLHVEELIPAALLIGIRNNKDFVRMIEMDDELVETLLINTKSVKLSLLHRYLLQIAFKKP